MRASRILLALVLAGTAEPSASSAAVFVADESLDEWAGIPVAVEMPVPAHDGLAHVVRVWAASTPERLWLRLELSEEARLAELDHLELHLDTDRDGRTGVAAGGIGADFTWHLGEEAGRAQVLGLPIRVKQGNVGARRAPTVSSRDFELSFDLRAQAAGGAIFPGADVRAVLCDASGGSPRCSAPFDFPPAAGTPPPASPPAPAAMARRDPAHLRVLTYNVLFDGLFERTDVFGRILRAIDPDVIFFQEIFEGTAEETAALLCDLLPGRAWQAMGGRGGVLASRVPIEESGTTGSARGGLWARLAPPDSAWARGPVLLGPRPPCCENETGRQLELDATMAWLRNARDDGRIAPGTPLVVAGDMNLVGRSGQLATLVSGAILDGAAWGAPFAPDWDGTGLRDARPRHAGGREIYTWRGDGSAFPPGRLDFILDSDSVLGLGTSFVLWTPDLSPEDLEALGLEASDTAAASDHLPVVADFYPLAGASR